MQTDYILEGAGYNGVDPEMLAAHDLAFYEIMYDGGEYGEWGGKGGKLIDMLYQTCRPELLELEKAAREDKTDAGRNVLEFLHVVRHCILTWIVRLWTLNPATARSM